MPISSAWRCSGGRSSPGWRSTGPTSATEDYGPARGFYQSMRYLEEARFRDFYKVGDDLILLKKKL